MTGDLGIHRRYLRVRQEARLLGAPGALWRELGLDRLRRSRERLRAL
jgi:hypothetical protein